VIEGQVAFTTSDGRFKFNVQEDVKGLDFIKKLRPVNYQFDTEAFDQFLMQHMPDSIKSTHTAGVSYTASKNIVRTGLIAQEVEKAAQETGFVTDIVHSPVNGDDNYSIQYGALVVPMIKAMQEQQTMIENLQTQIAALQAGGQRSNENGQGQKEAISTIELANNSLPIIYQNEPNPFNGSTIIRYFIPENVTGSAFVVFYDMYGKEVNKLEVKERGFGKIEANTENLASGIYSYSILVDGKSIETKKMICTR
jgi:hypothetical protein